MKREILIIVLSFVAMMGVHSAKAWGGTPHNVIAYAAQRHLTPQAKEKCDYYLKHTLAYYATWMDYWRSIPEYKSVNNPHSIQAMPDGVHLDWGGTPKGRAMGHLKNALEELSDGKYKNLPDSVVRQRLINMVHYIPDMHCPGHVRFPKESFPEYNFKVRSKGKVIGTHGFWDGSLLRGRKWNCKDFADNVDKDISPKQIKKWQSGTLDDWACDIIKNAHRRFELLPADTELSDLTSEEIEKVHQLADEMALKAVYRLAYVINTIFAE